MVWSVSKKYKKYQPSPRSPTATLHSMHNPKWPLGGPKIIDGVLKGVYPQIYRCSCQLRFVFLSEHSNANRSCQKTVFVCMFVCSINRKQSLITMMLKWAHQFSQQNLKSYANLHQSSKLFEEHNGAVGNIYVTFA